VVEARVRANRYIVIEGVIGAGKTSLTRLLAERLNAALLLEEVEENPFLKDFYTDRGRFAFQTQMHFLFSRYQQQRELRQQDLFREKTVSDYLFQKDRIFANLNLSDKELALYEKVVGWLELEVTRPDIVVYLQASTETLMERVARRGRSFERDMDRQYMQALNDSYNYFFFHYVEAPLLVVNTNGIDFVKNAEDLADLETRILGHHEGTIYYTPLPSKERRRIARRRSGEPAEAEVAEGGDTPPLFAGAGADTTPPGAPAAESAPTATKAQGERASRRPRTPRASRGKTKVPE
jgi:deoxyadenosine/deoxycytidine kinase